MLTNNNKPPRHPESISTTMNFGRLNHATQYKLYNTWQTLKVLLTDAKIKFSNLNNDQEEKDFQQAKAFALGLHSNVSFNAFKVVCNPLALSTLNPFPLLVSYRKNFPEHTLAEQLLKDPRHAPPLIADLTPV